MADLGEGVDMATFSQILEMDESEEDRDFSGPLVFGFFEQAEETLTSMETALKEKDLLELSKLGHFLKGSSATLGFNKVRDNCQIIQQYGHKQNLDGSPEDDEEVCVKKITTAVETLRTDMAELTRVLRAFFGRDE